MLPPHHHGSFLPLRRRRRLAWRRRARLRSLGLPPRQHLAVSRPRLLPLLALPPPPPTLPVLDYSILRRSLRMEMNGYGIVIRPLMHLRRRLV